MDDSSSDSDFDFEGFTRNDIFEGIVAANLAEREITDEQDVSRYDITEPDWKSENFVTPDVPPFMGVSGADLPSDFDVNSAKPVDYFSLFWSDDVFEKIVENTNKFSKFLETQKRVTNPEFVTKWENIALDEMKAYFGLNCMMGVCNNFRTRSYWSTDPFFSNIGFQQVKIA